MNYQKFMELVPKETKDFVFTVLDRLNFYENASLFIRTRGLDGRYMKHWITADQTKILSIMIKILNTTTYGSYSNDFLTRDIYYQNCNGSDIELNNIDISSFEKGSIEAVYFKKYIDYFSFLDKEIDYLTLSPLRIFNRALTKIYNETCNTEMYLISLQKALEILPNSSKMNEMEKKYLSEIRNDLYKNVSIEVIKVVENASIIFQKAKDNFSDYNDLSSITILMSILLSSSCKEIQSKLSSYEFDIVNKEKYSTFIENEKVDYEVVKYYFEKYFKFKNVNELFLGLFNRNVTNSVEVEKIFLSAGLTKEKAKSILLTPSKEEIISNFYSDIPPKEKGDYQLICSMYNSVNTQNKRIYPDDNMYLTLIIFDYQNNGKLSKYFLENGITLEMILSKYSIVLSDSQYIDYQTYLNEILIGYKDAKDKLKFMTSSDFIMNLFNTFTKNKTNNLDSDVINYYKLLEMKENEESYERIYKDKDKTYKEFFNTSYEIYEKLESCEVVNNVLSKTDLKVFSIMLTLYSFKSNIVNALSDVLKNTGLDENSLKKTLKDIYNVSFIFSCDNYLEINLSDGRVNTTLKQKFNNVDYPIEVEKVFGSYLEKSILKTLYKLFEEEKDNSLILKKLFMGKTIDEIKENMDKEINRVSNKKKYDDYKKMLCIENDNATLQLLEKLCKINLTNIKVNMLYEFISMNFDNDAIYFYQKSLEKYGITKESIIEKFGIFNSEFAYNDINLENFVSLENYFITEVNGHKYKNSLQNILINLIESNYFDDLINNKKALLYELTNTKRYVPSLSETIENLNNLEVENIDIQSLNSVMNFGKSLNAEYEVLSSEERKALSINSASLSIQTINDLLSKKNKPKKSFWSFLVEPYEEEKSITDISTLKNAINDNIKILSKELLTFDLIRKYITIYFHKNNEYSKKSNEILNILNEKLSKINPEDALTYASFLEVNTMQQIMKEKNNRFNVTRTLLNQELFKINQIIINHFVTINALEMARDDLLPLIGSEVAINMGITSAQKANELTNNVMSLFKAILDRNVSETKKLLETISAEYPQNLGMLNSNVNNYLNMLETNEGLERTL